MISILRVKDEEALRKELRSKEELCLEAIGAYATAVEAVCDHLLRMCPPMIDRHGAELRGIAEEVRPGMRVDELESSRTRFLTRVSRLGQDGAAEYEATARDLRDMLRLVSSATETLQTQSDGSGAEWNRFTTEVERIAALGDLQDVRSNLRREVRHMNECMQAMVRDNALVIGRLRTELATMRKRTNDAEEQLVLDPLTGVCNRRGIEESLEERARAGESFCVVFFDIVRFHAVNDRYGLETGDEVLRQFSQRLASSIRDSDRAGRWSCDRFVAVIGCPVHIGIARARQIHAKVNGRYELLTAAGASASVEIHSAMGIAEYRQGESAQALMERAGQSLLAAKAQSHSSTP
ncbi:MAG: diguanylate cyclase [Bryobacterales bacterium]|nr:diguanylate cyclase [Bryobacterales bacterium]